MKLYFIPLIRVTFYKNTHPPRGRFQTIKFGVTDISENILQLCVLKKSHKYAQCEKKWPAASSSAFETITYHKPLLHFMVSFFGIIICLTSI